MIVLANRAAAGLKVMEHARTRLSFAIYFQTVVPELRGIVIIRVAEA